MPELRWTLLILGALFIGALAVWEIRRKRHARGQDGSGAPGGRDGERVTPTLDEGDGVSRAPAERPRGDMRALREPTLTFPEVHPEPRSDRLARPPVVEIDEASLAELKIEPHTVVDEFSATDRVRASDEALGLAPTVPTAQTAPISGTSSTGPRLAVPPSARAAFPAEAPVARAEPAWGAASESAAFESPEEAAADAPDSASEPAGFRARSPDPAFGEPPRTHGAVSRDITLASIPDDEERPAEAEIADDDVGEPVARMASPPPLHAEDFDVPEPIVDWPDESSRKIIALRLVSGTGERFQGRAVRQALAAEGFQIGKFEIFHKPGPDARAVLSAASLTKPGTFTLSTMDGQRYGGLSLFAVLPGPLSPVETFDELLLTARSLNDRLRGALQDERGEPLTPVRSASIRDNLASASSSTAH